MLRRAGKWKRTGKEGFRVSWCGRDERKKLQKHCVPKAAMISDVFHANPFTLTILCCSDHI